MVPRESRGSRGCGGVCALRGDGSGYIYEGIHMFRLLKVAVAAVAMIGVLLFVAGSAGASGARPSAQFCASVKTLSNLHSIAGVKAVVGTKSEAVYGADIAALVRAGDAEASSPSAHVARELASALRSAHSYEIKYSTASFLSKAGDVAKIAFYDTTAAALGVDLYVYYRGC